MTEAITQHCEQCRRKAFRTPTNRCMYCGHALPESLKFTDSELDAYKKRHEEMAKDSADFLKGMKPGKPVLQDEEMKKRNKGKTSPAPDLPPHTNGSLEA